MHNRLKVRTSAEEAARKKKEQELKVKAYRGGMTKIMEKKTLNQYDDEMIQLTSGILARNPDITTLWNIRRQCILQQQENSVDAAVESIFEKDLNFTESCLLVQPKSYCVWHHRCWILEHQPKPNWNQEVDLCTQYLKKDERNFHVWDYRRYVVEKANIAPDKELDFCTDKIQKNFSNYSSWHYRSKLLPVLYPHDTDKSRPICEEKLKEELEMVLTAAFTDPNDSSAWFYQRWLLGYSRPELDLAAFKLTKTYAIISFTKPVNLHDELCSIALDTSTKFETKYWRPIITSSSHTKYSSIWILEDSFELNADSETTFQLEFVDELNVTHHLEIFKTEDGLFGIKMPKFGYEFEATVIDELKQQLEHCNQLLEYEADSKWTLLTAALLMRAIDRNQYHEKTLQYLDLLKKVDTMRTGYYTDLANKWSIEFILERWIKSKTFSQSIDLSRLNLVSIFYEQFLCVANDINFEYNELRNVTENNKLIQLKACGVNIVI